MVRGPLGKSSEGCRVALAGGPQPEQPEVRFRVGASRLQNLETWHARLGVELVKGVGKFTFRPGHFNHADGEVAQYCYGRKWLGASQVFTRLVDNAKLHYPSVTLTRRRED